MEFISSDTNVWIDFEVISRLGLPFRLPYTYIMYTESIDSELLMPSGIKEKLTAAGLVGVDITTQEFLIADEWGKIYPRLSGPDRIALAIAKERKIVLLTGDMALRKAAEKEGVPVLGTIGIMDKLLEGKHITLEEYITCISDFLTHKGREIRLPRAELEKRLKQTREQK